MPLSDIGPYRLLRLIKSGGQGSVYAAEDRRLGRRVAVKLRPLPDDPQQRRSRLAEARSLAALNHPLIVQLYDVIELPEAVALVMEYVPGHDLEELLAVAEPAPTAVLQLGQDICTALAAAHSRGIFHGDLKAANVLVVEDGSIKLTDFGAEAVGGSAGALAPERLAGVPADARSDLYSLGCLLYRMLTGRQPFPAVTSDSYGADLPAGFQELGIALPASLENLLFQLLDPAPAKRPATALDVRGRLLAVARALPSGETERLSLPSDRDLPASQSTPASRQLQSAARRAARWWKPALGFAVMTLGCALALTWWGPRPVRVHVEAVHSAGAEVGAESLGAMLEQLLGSGDRWLPVPAPEADALLRLEVICNPHMCSSQLLLSSDRAERSDTRAMLPDADQSAWRRRLAEGLEALRPAD